MPWANQKNKQLRILDMQGRILRQLSSKEQLLQFDISHLKQGTYIIQIETKEVSFSKLFIKQ